MCNKYMRILGIFCLLISAQSICAQDPIPEKSHKIIEYVAKQLGMQDFDVEINPTHPYVQYWFGYHAAFAIPFLNVIYLNETWFGKLEPKEKLFLIARCMVYLKNAPKYLTGSHLLPFIDKKHPWHLEYTVTLPLDVSKEKVISQTIRVSPFIPYLIWFNRQNEYEADHIAAQTFDCVDAACSVFEKIKKFEHDGTQMGKINARIGILKLASRLLESKCKYFYNPQRLMPGQICQTPDWLSNKITSLPLLKYTTNQPCLDDRIAALKRNDLSAKKLLSGSHV